MRVFQAVSAAILSAVVAGGAVNAQAPSQAAGPKEQPPAGYTGNQYVDSSGCVFIRAGVGGQTAWVPRVSRDRKFVCGYEPTFPPGMLDAVEAMKTPAPDAAAPAAAPTVVVAAPEISVTEAPKAAPKAMSAARSTAPAASSRAHDRAVRLVHSASVNRAATRCLPQGRAAQRYLLSDGRRVTQCAPAVSGEPVAYLNSLGAPDLAVAPGAPSPADARRALAANQGAYRVTWSNGPIAGAARVAQPPAAKTPAPAKQPAGTGRYVQVGVFAEPANAQAAIARLRSLGLPVASATGRTAGRPVKAIMAGPFATAADINAALSKARGAGFSDAYIRG